MRSFVATLFFVLFSFALYGQSGNFYLKNYKNPLATTDQLNTSALQGQNGKMYFANTRGIITYDGAVWDLVQTQSTPHTLAQSEDGTIFVACRQHFGYLRKDELGITHYEIIASTYPDEATTQKIIFQGNFVYFFSEKALYQVSLKDYQIRQVWKSKPSALFSACFEHQGQIFIHQLGEGLLRLQNRQLILHQKNSILKNITLLFYIQYNPKQILLGLDDNSLWLFDGKEFEPFEIEQEEYLEKHILTDGIYFSEKYLGLGTLTGGCLVIDKITGEIQQIINYQTGLPDNEVLALGKDGHGGLWICHERGISRADLTLPILTFSDYLGLRGSPNSILKTDSALYVATNEGLFYLTKVSKMEQLVRLIKEERKEVKVIERNIHTTIQIQENPFVSELMTPLTDPEENADRATRRQNRKNQRIAKREARNASENQEEDSPQITQTDTIQVKKVVSESPQTVKYSSKVSKRPLNNELIQGDEINLQSIPFIYSSIVGIDVKCRQVISFKDRILVATSKGLFEITNLYNARLIYPDVYINYIHLSQNKANQVYLATQEGLTILSLENNQWQIELEEKQFNEAIYSLDEHQGSLWLGGARYIHKIQLESQNQVSEIKTYSLPNSYAEMPVVKIVNGKPIFVISTGIYTLDEKGKKIILEPTLQKYFNPRTNTIYNQRGYTWLLPPKEDWLTLEGNSGDFSEITPFLGFFENISDIYIDSQNNFWIIANNQIHKIKSDAYLQKQTIFKAFIRKAFYRKEPLSLNNLNLNSSQNNLRFELSSSYFLEENRIEYQYKLEGLENDWSEWNSSPEINFPILPSGNYVLRVRAKNVFGQESQEDKVEFVIHKKIWEYPAFYLLALVVLIGIGYLILKIRLRSVDISKKKLENKVREKTQEIHKKQISLEEALEEISTQKEQIQQKNEELHRVNSQLESTVEERTTKLKSTLLQLLQTNKELDTFIYRASHDLKGPISRLIGLVNLIRIDPKQEEIAKHLNYVEFTAQKMDSMLDKLMNIHSIHSEQIEIEKIYVGDLLQDIKRKFQAQIGHQKVFLMTKIQAPEYIYSDTVLLNIIIRNLLENTVQFANQSTEVFSVSKFELNVDEEFIHIKVTDNGLGILSNIQDRIFDMFFRGHESSQGNGLGLYLVKKATEKLNGQIHFKSEPKNFTSFSVILPNPEKKTTPNPEVSLKE